MIDPPEYVIKFKNGTHRLEIGKHPLLQHTLRVDYVICSSHRFVFELCDFPGAPDCSYDSDKSLVALIWEIINFSKQKVFPCIDFLDSSYLEIKTEWYNKLSTNTERRVHLFQSEFQMDNCKTATAKLDKLNRILSKFKRYSRKDGELTESELENLLNLAAYYGDMVRIHQTTETNMFWGWTLPGDYPKRYLEKYPFIPKYGLKCSPIDFELFLDPLIQVAYAWNFSCFPNSPLKIPLL